MIWARQTSCAWADAFEGMPLLTAVKPIRPKRAVGNRIGLTLQAGVLGRGAGLSGDWVRCTDQRAQTPIFRGLSLLPRLAPPNGGSRKG